MSRPTRPSGGIVAGVVALAAKPILRFELTDDEAGLLAAYRVMNDRARETTMIGAARRAKTQPRRAIPALRLVVGGRASNQAMSKGGNHA
ncbi:hypothetical protein AAKU55_005068 [Oxalobacteraceae bacterium GrIS 1.11]